MALPYRRLLFSLFSLSFILTASLVLFYAYGYRFSFERGIFIYTGSLSLKTNVQEVTIQIDDIEVPTKRLGLLNNSIHIAGLNPGEHFVQVNAPGYLPWEKKVVIQSGLTTEFWNIFLVEADYKRLPVTNTEQVIKLFPAPNGLLAAIKKNGNRYAVDVLDVKNNTDEEVYATENATFIPTDEVNVEWSPESHKLIIPLEKDGQPLYEIVTLKTNEVLSLNDVTRIASPLTHPRWDAETQDILFFMSAHTLYRYDTSNPDASPQVIAEHVAAYDLSGQQLYYLSNETGLVYQINGQEDDTPLQITPEPITLIPDPAEYSLITYDETRMAILEKASGTLWIYDSYLDDSPLKQIATSIKGTQYSDDGKKLLLFSDYDISVYFNKDWETQPFRAKDSLMQIARFSAPIANVGWTKDYEHVIFSMGKNVKMTELDNRDQRDLVDLLALEHAPFQLLPRFGTDLIYVVTDSQSDISNGDTVFTISLPQYISPLSSFSF